MFSIYKKPIQTAAMFLALLAALHLLGAPGAGATSSHPGSYAPVAAYDPAENRFLLVFTDIDTIGWPAIYGIFVGPDASPQGDAFRISDQDAELANNTRATVALDTDTGEYLVAWHDYRTGNADIYARTVDNASLEMGDVFAISNLPSSEEFPVAGFSPEAQSFLVAWQDARSGDYDIRARVISIDSLPPYIYTGNEFALLNAPGDQIFPAIAYHYEPYNPGAPGAPENSDDHHPFFLVTFEDHAEDPEAPQISGQLVDAYEGYPLIAPNLGLDVSGHSGGYFPAVANTASPEAAFIVTWIGYTGEILARYMDTTGSSAPPFDKVFEPEGQVGRAERVSVSADQSTGRTVLLWQELLDGQRDIYASFITPHMPATESGADVYHVTQVTSNRATDEINMAAYYNSRMPSFLVAYESTNHASAFDILLTTITDPDYPEIELMDPVPPYGDLAMSYPGVLFNTTVSHTMSIYNDSPVANLSITNIATTGPFEVAGENCTLEPMGPEGGPCAITVEYAPQNSGTSVGALTISSNDPNEPEVSVSLSGRSLAPKIRITDTSIPSDDLSLDFGIVRTGDSAGGTVTVYNDGDFVLSLGILSGYIKGFSITADNCSLQYIHPGGFCTVSIEASPDYIGSYSGFLWIKSDDPDNPVTSISLYARGQESELSIAGGESIEMSGAAVGQGITKEVNITNQGGAPLSIQNISPPALPFVLDADHCTGRTIGPGGSCSLSISFTPQGMYTQDSIIIIHSNDSQRPELTIPVRGRGTTPVAAVHSSGESREMDFGHLPAGENAIETLSITNIGLAALRLSRATVDGPGYRILSDNCSGRSLEYAGTCKVTVELSARAAALYTGTLRLQSNDPEEEIIIVPLSGDARSHTATLRSDAISGVE